MTLLSLITNHRFFWFVWDLVNHEYRLFGAVFNKKSRPCPGILQAMLPTPLTIIYSTRLL